jgi:hypothetical protein
MMNSRLIGIVGAALLGALVSQSAQAQVAYPDRATLYKTFIVRAMDECTSGFVTVVEPGSISGCVQANSTTDSALTAVGRGILQVRRSRVPVGKKINGSQTVSKIIFRGAGFAPAGTPMGVQLTLRTSNTLGLPSGSKTYEDQTIICGDTAGGSCGNFTSVSPSGRITLRQTLGDCLTANGLSTVPASGNIELLGVELVNCSTGKVAGVPGVLIE